MVLRRWTPRYAGKWAAEAARLHMEAVGMKKRIRTIHAPPVMANPPPASIMATKMKKATVGIMTKTTMRTRMNMANNLIRAMRKKKTRKKANGAAAITIRIINRAGPVSRVAPIAGATTTRTGQTVRATVHPVVKATALLTVKVTAHPIVRTTIPAVRVPPTAAAPILPEEDSPAWIATSSAASPAKGVAPITKKEAPMVMMKVAAAVVAATARAQCPEVAKVPVLLAARAQVHPVVKVQVLPVAKVQAHPVAAAPALQEEVSPGIQVDNSPAAAVAQVMAAVALTIARQH